MIQKSEIRQTCLERRLRMPQAERESAARRACRLFFENISLPAGTTVAGYWPVRGELDDMLILREAQQRGHVCALPCVVDEAVPLEFRFWDDASPMTAGRYGIAEPTTGSVVSPDMLLVPMAAFDARRYRLGYGGGFYDRTLAQLREKKAVLAIGLAYEGQVCDHLPTEKHDIKMDMIVTDGHFYA